MSTMSQGKRIIDTRLHAPVTVREENAAAALEVMSRFAVDPRWLIYLPPTMSPPETRTDGELLEHPTEAFAVLPQRGRRPRHLRGEAHGLARGRRRLPRRSGRRRAFRCRWQPGRIYTRTGRPFFSETATEAAVLDRVRGGDDARRALGRAVD